MNLQKDPNWGSFSSSTPNNLASPWPYFPWNSKKLITKKKYAFSFSFFFFGIYIRWWILTKLIFSNHFTIYVSQVIMLHTLNLYRVVCQFCLNKTGKINEQKNSNQPLRLSISLPDLASAPKGKMALSSGLISLCLYFLYSLTIIVISC